MVARIREFLVDSLFYGLAVGLLVLIGYMIYLGWAAEHPQAKQHWSQGPQDPEPTH